VEWMQLFDVYSAVLSHIFKGGHGGGRVTHIKIRNILLVTLRKIY